MNRALKIAAILAAIAFVAFWLFLEPTGPEALHLENLINE